VTTVKVDSRQDQSAGSPNFLVLSRIQSVWPSGVVSKVRITAGLPSRVKRRERIVRRSSSQKSCSASVSPQEPHALMKMREGPGTTALPESENFLGRGFIQSCPSEDGGALPNWVTIAIGPGAAATSVANRPSFEGDDRFERTSRPVYLAGL